MNSESWNARYQEKELVWSKGPNQFLVAEAKTLAVGRALDIACGEGRNALWLAEQGWTVTGTDYASVGIAKAKHRAKELQLSVDFDVADATQAINGCFDFILIFYLHLPREQNRAALAHAIKALSPKGTLLYVGHDQRNIAEGVGGPQDPSILYGPSEIATLVTELNPALTVERAETVVRKVNTDEGARDALDVLVRVKY